jgi:hypothetical protein
MKLQRDLIEYFKYHPPVTEKRKAAHSRVSAETMKAFCSFCDERTSPIDLAEKEYDDQRKMLEELCLEPTCYKWALGALIGAKQASLSDFRDREEKIFMYMQQFRMFLNQAITIQELDDIRTIEN